MNYSTEEQEEDNSFQDYSQEIGKVKNLEYKKRVRKMLEDKLERKRLREELEDELDTEFDWDDLDR